MNPFDIIISGITKRLAIFLLAGLMLGSVPGMASCGTALSQKDDEGLPDFAYSSATSLASYRVAVAEGELLSILPCYCGCGRQAIPHKNLKECFFKPDGTFEPHASGCDLCGKEALDAKAWKEKGYTSKEIRSMIEQKYQAYGPGTDTPPVP